MVCSGEGSSTYCVAVYTVTMVTNMKCVYRQNNRQIRNHDDTDFCTASTDIANIVLFSYILYSTAVCLPCCSSDYG